MKFPNRSLSIGQPLDLFSRQWFVLAVLAGALGLQVWHVSDVYARTSPYFDGSIPLFAKSGAVAMELFILIFTANDRKDEPKFFCGLSIALNVVYHFPAWSDWHYSVTDPMQTAGRLLSSACIPLAVYFCSDLLRSMRNKSETKAKAIDLTPVLEHIASLHSEHVKDMRDVTVVLGRLDSLYSETKAELDARDTDLEQISQQIVLLQNEIHSLESEKETKLPFACRGCKRRFATKNGRNPHEAKCEEFIALTINPGNHV